MNAVDYQEATEQDFISGYLEDRLFIYGLVDPMTNQVRYVGRTGNLKIRYKTHCSLNGKSSWDNLEKTKWVSQLATGGLKPKLIIFETWLRTYEVEESKKESFWVRHCLSNGCDLLNKLV